MKLAVMQPYIFPYIGYFQLINAVDVFVFYDDVNFIKKGWINRNNILGKSTSIRFTVPLKKISQNKQICDTNTSIDQKWLYQFFKTAKQSYIKAPYFDEVFPIIENVFKVGEGMNIGSLAAKSILEVCDYLNIKKQWHFSSQDFAESKKLGRTKRLVYIAKTLYADEYVNPIGGKILYNNEDFLTEGIALKFIKMGEVEYPQFSEPFIPNLSILDVLMFNSKEQIIKILQNYTLTD